MSYGNDGCFCYPKLGVTFKASYGSIYKISGLAEIKGYTEYANLCSSKDGKLASSTGNEAGNESLDACKEQCDHEPSCNAITWFDSKVHGPCLLVFTTNGKNVAVKALSGTRYKDAECYIKPIDKSVAPVIGLKNAIHVPAAGASAAGDALKDSKSSYS